MFIYQKHFLFYQRVLAQKPKDKNKIYSLHEPDVYVIAKGKDHKQYEYGNKVSIFRQDDVCTEHYLCTNIASVAYRLFDGFVSVAVSMAYGNS
jgi:hypothetical protein